MLSDLQLALLGAGIIAIAGVWSYNRWQERKARRAAQSIFQQVHDDALLVGRADGNVRREPVFAIDEAAESAVVAADETASPPAGGEMPSAAPWVEPMTEEPAPVAVADTSAAMEPAAPPPSVLAEFPPQYAESLVDCVLRLTTSAPVPAPAVWVLQESWATRVGKPVRWLVREAEGHWQPLVADEIGRFTEWVVALQLADRRGAVSAGELRHFLDGVQLVAEKIGAAVALPDAEQIVAHANALDTFCAGVDIQFKLHIVETAGGVFNGTKLRGIAEAAGMTLESDGRFHARDANGGELYTLANFGSEGFTADNLRSLATHGLTLSIDVPRVDDGVAAFNRMLLAGQRLARALDGVLVDAQRAPLAENMIAAIRAKIGELQQTMRDSGIMPGSALALRLFS